MAEFTKLCYQKGELNQALSEFFGALIEQKVFDAVLLPAKQPTRGVMQTLISRPDKLGAIDPWAPVVPQNAAKLVSALTASPSGRPAAAVLRSCEVRALIELTKLKQATQDDVVLFGIDCPGRFENHDFLAFSDQGGTSEDFLSGDFKGFEVAGACKLCQHPVAGNVDVRLCMIGAENAVYVEWLTERGNAVREKLGMQTEAGPKNRDSEVEAIKKQRTEERDRRFAEFREATRDFQSLQAHLAGCVNCYNCRVACPVCYCKECVFVTDTFRHDGSQYMGWADKRGALKMPVDSLFYHLTRLAHISTLCVGCGQCTSACPNDIQLAPLFCAVAEKTQARFDYRAGRSPDEAQPLATFHDDELVEVTGQVK
jgi:formate dehydrogenase subunit beta